jgi:hypothetical protein
MSAKSPLIEVLRGLVQLLENEATVNPAFAAKLEALVLPVQGVTERRAKGSAKKAADAPDVHQELAARGEAPFRAWLHEQTADVLKAIIRREDLDPARRASKWKDEKKLADFIADGLRARMSRGSAFIGRQDGG